MPRCSHCCSALADNCGNLADNIVRVLGRRYCSWACAFGAEWSWFTKSSSRRHVWHRLERYPQL